MYKYYRLNVVAKSFSSCKSTDRQPPMFMSSGCQLEGVPFLVEQAKRLPYGRAVRTTNRQPHTERSRFMKRVIRITNQGKVKDVHPANLTTVPALDEIDTTVACIQALIPIGLK